jgi:Zn-dependent protease
MVSLLLNNPILFISIILIVIISICIHKLAHGLAAIEQGDDTPIKTGHITWNPVVHMGWESLIFLCVTGIAWGTIPITPAKFNSAKWGKAYVALAGPTSNLSLSLLAIVLLRWTTPSNAELWDSLPLVSTILLLIALINLKLFLFNLIPVPPLDGYQVFSGLIPELQVLEKNALGLALLMILFLSPFGDGLDWLAKGLTMTLLGSAASSFSQFL